MGEFPLEIFGVRSPGTHADLTQIPKTACHVTINAVDLVVFAGSNGSGKHIGIFVEDHLRMPTRQNSNAVPWLARRYLVPAVNFFIISLPQYASAKRLLRQNSLAKAQVEGPGNLCPGSFQSSQERGERGRVFSNVGDAAPIIMYPGMGGGQSCCYSHVWPSLV